MYGLVRLYRKELGLNQTDFGKKYGLSHTTVSDIERGRLQGIKASIMEDIIDWLLSIVRQQEEDTMVGVLEDYTNWLVDFGEQEPPVVAIAGYFPDFWVSEFIKQRTGKKGVKRL